jgi:hypothetical protein
MLRRFLAGSVALAALATIGATAGAQATCGNTAASNATCSPAGTTVSATVQRIVFMSITNPAFSLTAPTDLNFTAGGTTTITDDPAQTVVVRANAAWNLQIKGAAWTGTGNNSKAVGDLAWSKDGGGYTAMTTSNAAYATGSATGGLSMTVGYRTAWSLTSDTPGTYNMALTFTLTAP